MKCAASKSILRFSIVSATMAISLATTTNAWSADLKFVSTREASGANDFVDWSSMSNISTTGPSTFNLTSAGQLSITGTQNGSFQIRTQSSPGFPVTFDTANAIQRSNAIAASGSDPKLWDGNFTAGEQVYWNNGSEDGLTLTFSTPVSSVGAQLNSLFYRNSIDANPSTPNRLLTSLFEGEITVFDGTNPLGTALSGFGRTTAAADGTAGFFGVTSSSADITKIVFNTYNTAGRGKDANFAINRLSIGNPQAVPEPFSILGTLFGGAAALKMRKRFKANNKL